MCYLYLWVLTCFIREIDPSTTLWEPLISYWAQASGFQVRLRLRCTRIKPACNSNTHTKPSMRMKSSAEAEVLFLKIVAKSKLQWKVNILKRKTMNITMKLESAIRTIRLSARWFINDGYEYIWFERRQNSAYDWDKYRSAINCGTRRVALHYSLTRDPFHYMLAQIKIAVIHFIQQWSIIIFWI